MKISEDVLKSKGIPYVQKYPYGELSKTSKNKGLPDDFPGKSALGFQQKHRLLPLLYHNRTCLLNSIHFKTIVLRSYEDT